MQRYGEGIAGGAEAHARELTKRLAAHLDIEVLTTAARDYRTWENAYTAGTEWVDDVPVRRFPVMNTRAWDFKLYERRAFSRGHTLEDERTFVDAQGPYVPDLLEHLWRNDVRPGKKLTIVEVAPWAGTITAASNGQRITLGLPAAAKIWVYIE